MLTNARLQTLVWTSKKDEAARFYGDILGLNFSGESHGALVYDVDGGALRVSPVPTTRPSEHTVVGFSVDDIVSAVTELVSRGVEIEHVLGSAHDDLGIWTAPDQTQVAWFRDPDGNLISVVQYI